MSMRDIPSAFGNLVNLVGAKLNWDRWRESIEWRFYMTGYNAGLEDATRKISALTNGGVSNGNVFGNEFEMAQRPPLNAGDVVLYQDNLAIVAKATDFMVRIRFAEAYSTLINTALSDIETIESKGLSAVVHDVIEAGERPHLVRRGTKMWRGYIGRCSNHWYDHESPKIALATAFENYKLAQR